MLQAIRQRFLLFAGMFPYLLGSAVAFREIGSLNFLHFLLGLIGIAAVLLAVQVFNENFDIALGSEGVFTSRKPSPLLPFRAGVVASAVALAVGLYLVAVRGWPLLIFIAFGAVATVFYLGPPIRLSYRGLGELAIFLAYGPFMTIGAYYLQTQGVGVAPLIASLVLGFLVLALAIANEVPDYHGDKLVGKRNIVVRIGRRRATILYAATLSISFGILALGVYWGVIPGFSLLTFATLPLACWSVLVARKNYDHPRRFVPAIQGAIFLCTIVACLLTASYFI